ncbi:MAG TPA: autotransporter-associated beta strand repeat-containing protein [Lacipirellulaceae bacterium]|nr:autotransporter-associated beta strand repeat-containing protein [Lacipirellulaceae bacterium]
MPAADSTPLSAQFSAAVSLSGSGSLSVHTLQVDATRVFSAGGTGALTVNTLNLMPHASSPARLLLTGDLNVAPLAGAAAAINKGAGTGASGLVDLGGAQRVLHIADGAAPVDLAINVPVTNGGLTKAGPGTLALTVAGSYTGDTIVDAGTLRLGTASLANSADVRLSSGALLDLNFAGTDVIRSLYIDGESQAAGIWGAVGSGAEFTSSLLAGTGLLNVTTYVPPLVPIPGDFNGDGLVDHDDLAIWSQNFGRQGDATFADGDANGDQNVDGADLLVWQRHLGAGEPTSPAAAGVPEPGTGALALGAAISILWRRRRYGN